MNIEIPQLIYLMLFTACIVVSIFEHGKTRTTNMWAQLIGASITLSLLIWGGFFG